MKSFWSFYAFIYDVLNTFSPYVALQAKVVEALQLIPYLRIGDFGCGTGNTIRNILRVSRWKTEIVAFDAEPAMLVRAAKKTKNDPRVRFVRKKMEDADESGLFDRIVSVNSLYAVSDLERMFSRWHDMLDDGGIAVVANPFLPSLKPIFGEFFLEMWRKKDVFSFLLFLVNIPRWIALILINQYIAGKAKGKTFHFLPPEDLKIIAARAGFEVSSEEIVYGKGSTLFSFRKNAGKVIRRAHTFREIGECYRIRYNAYCEGLKSLPGEDYPDKKESDAYDEYAVHFIWEEDGSVVGCIRLIPDYGSGFLLEDGGRYPIPVALDGERKNILEFSRMAVDPSHRRKNIGYAAAEYAARWGFERTYCTKWIAMCQERVWNGFMRNGWSVALWGEYRGYHETLSAPGTLIPPFLNETRNQ